jgi:hypothetical protein
VPTVAKCQKTKARLPCAEEVSFLKESARCASSKSPKDNVELLVSVKLVSTANSTIPYFFMPT